MFHAQIIFVSGELIFQNSAHADKTSQSKTAATATSAPCENCKSEAPIIKVPQEFKTLSKQIVRETPKPKAKPVDKRKKIALDYLMTPYMRCMTNKTSYKTYKHPDDDKINGKSWYLFNRYKRTFIINSKKEISSMSDKSTTISRAELFAIDALARTLVGEMRSCGDGEFRPEYVEVVARTILNRAEKCINNKNCGYISTANTAPKNLFEAIPAVIGENNQYNNWRSNDLLNAAATLCPEASTEKIDRSVLSATMKIAVEVVFNTEKFKKKTATVGSNSFSFKSLQHAGRKKNKRGKLLSLEENAEQYAFQNTRLKKGIRIGTTSIRRGTKAKPVNDYNCLAVYEEIPQP